jgi:hypothetical protein
MRTGPGLVKRRQQARNHVQHAGAKNAHVQLAVSP